MAMDKAVKKAFIRYTKKKFPDESEQITVADGRVPCAVAVMRKLQS